MTYAGEQQHVSNNRMFGQASKKGKKKQTQKQPDYEHERKGDPPKLVFT